MQDNMTFTDLFAPAKPAATTTATPEVHGPNNATAATQQPAAPAAPVNGSPTTDNIFSGLKHTEISSPGGPTVTGPSAPGSQPSGQPGASAALGGMVKGEWAVNVIDSLLPAALVLLFHAFDVTLRKTELQLTASEKATLAPIWQKCLDSITLNFENPWSLLAITMGAIYGGKAMEKGIIGYMDKQGEKRDAEASKAKAKAASQEDPKTDYANQSAADIQSGAVVTPGSELPFTEDEIRRRMKEGKCSREKAIVWLKKRYQVAA